MAGFDNLAEAVGGLGDMFSRVFAFGWIEREAADELRFEGVGQVARTADLAF